LNRPSEIFLRILLVRVQEEMGTCDWKLDKGRKVVPRAKCRTAIPAVMQKVGNVSNELDELAKEIPSKILKLLPFFT
jgi:hypothetical protein